VGEVLGKYYWRLKVDNVMATKKQLQRFKVAELRSQLESLGLPTDGMFLWFYAFILIINCVVYSCKLSMST